MGGLGWCGAGSVSGPWGPGKVVVREPVKICWHCVGSNSLEEICPTSHIYIGNSTDKPGLKNVGEMFGKYLIEQSGAEEKICRLGLG